MISEIPGFHSRLKHLQQLVAGYQPPLPFHHYLRRYFTAHRQFGSTDRKFYRAWSYAWWRLGNALKQIPFADRLACAWYLVHGSGDPFLDALLTVNGKAVPAGGAATSLQARLNTIAEWYPDFDSRQLFPTALPLSGTVDGADYGMSMLRLPQVFIRMNPNHEQAIKAELDRCGIAYDEPAAHSLRLAPQTNLDKVTGKVRDWFEVQDLSSQQAGNLVPAERGQIWWDCCCGSGGKSLQLLERNDTLQLTATDNREALIENFKVRTRNDSKRVQAAVGDVARSIPAFIGSKKFDGILADVPCSGSGTWARNPEALSFHDDGKLGEFVTRQRHIVRNAIQALKPEGVFCYITCSVFRCENEEMIGWVEANSPLRCTAHQLIDGREAGADTLFFATFSAMQA